MTGFEQLKAISTSGTQYIDTGYVANANTKIVASVSFVDTIHDMPLFGVRTATNANSFVGWIEQYETDYPAVCFVYGSNSASGVGMHATGVPLGDFAEYSFSKDGVYINGELKQSVTQTGAVGSSYTLYLFGLNAKGSADSRKFYGLTAWVKIYDGDTLVRDYIPVRQLNNSEIGMYDLVDGKFYTNAGTGSFQSAWVIKDGEYPQIEGVDNAQPFSFEEPYPTWVWRLSPNYVKYPYLAPLTVITKPSAVKQHDYITVHDMMTEQDGFENNGLRILFPTSCDETEELNGGFEIVLEHPIDKDGAWEQLKELNVLKVNGQLFPIYRVVSNFNGNSGKITVYARHMFYFLLARWIFSAKISALSGQEALAQIMSAAESFNRDGLIDYQFTASSNLEGDFSANLSEQTPISAIMGSDKSLIEVLGGELYRDNFYFSVNKHKENSKENAFDIRVGLNLQGIKREIDYSDFCTYLRVFDGFGNWWAVSYVPSGRFSHNVVRSVTFKYDSPPGQERLAKDGQAYFDTIKEPRITYTVSLADVRNNPDYQEFGNLPEYNVGDSGRIYDERLGIYTEQRIIRRKVDRLTGLVKEVTFGNAERSLTRKPKFANTIATADDKYLLNQMTQAEAKAINTHADMAKYMHAELARFTHAQLGGN